MKDGTELVDQSVHAIAASSKTSPTAAGPTEHNHDNEALIDTINQVFSLFRINYHNQYHAAFGELTVLNQAKRLWKESLYPFSSEQILRAARTVIEESEYLPNINKILTACEATLTELGLPEVRDAYTEAANAPSPKNAQSWSHPAVYLAGKAIGWRSLSHMPEPQSYPLYARAYRTMIKRVLNGEQLTVDAPPLLEQDKKPPLSHAKISQQLENLKNLLSE